MLRIAYETYFYNLSIGNFSHYFELSYWTFVKHYAKFLLLVTEILEEEGLNEFPVELSVSLPRGYYYLVLLSIERFRPNADIQYS